jgi:hypothetical protein
VAVRGSVGGAVAQRGSSRVRASVARVILSVVFAGPASKAYLARIGVPQFGGVVNAQNRDRAFIQLLRLRSSLPSCRGGGRPGNRTWGRFLRKMRGLPGGRKGENVLKHFM